MKINVHAGHNPDGKVACGAVGRIKESTEARKVVGEIVDLLKAKGHTVHNCTVDNGTSQGNVLVKILDKCNANKVDLDVSIHFNSGRNDLKGDGENAGCEVLIYSNSSKAKPYATNVCKAIEKLGFNNRGVKVEDKLYFLRETSAPAMLIECCFVDDADDVKLYSYKSMAKAIVNGILA
jgi:N-acetylmuramoyl-L-alanine amidase